MMSFVGNAFPSSMADAGLRSLPAAALSFARGCA